MQQQSVHNKSGDITNLSGEPLDTYDIPAAGDDINTTTDFTMEQIPEHPREPLTNASDDLLTMEL